MVLLFVAVLCCIVVLHFLVVYCRSCLAESSKVLISGHTRDELELKEGEAAGDDFPRIVALARLCPDAKGAHRLFVVRTYYRCLTATYQASVVRGSRFSKVIQRERRACTHFAAVFLAQRIAQAREMVKESRRSF